ncbi:Protein croquemort [Nymphon striatum]|nr:Protein croquemort [Nymphon striatum]
MNKLLAPGNEAYKQWVKPTIPIYLKFYFFNCTNIQNFTKAEEIPVFQELGPYVYREYRKKVNISDSGDDFLMYNQQKWWEYDTEMSNGSLKDLISTINVPVVAAVHKGRFDLGLKKLILSEAIKRFGNKIHVTKTVGQFLFEGYQDDVIDFGRNMTKFTGIEIPFDKFGWYYNKNNSLGGTYIVNNGKADINNVGYIESWKNMSKVPFFGKYCNYINGTAADVFPPFMYDDQHLEIFAPDLCRCITLAPLLGTKTEDLMDAAAIAKIHVVTNLSLTFDFEKNVEVKSVKARRFLPERYLLDSGAMDPSNQCFCSGECTRPGVLNMSSCQDGAPAFISFPHFLHADRFYTDQVIGMKPDKEKHQFVMDIQPDLGIPANVNGRFQINILVERVPGFELFDHFTRQTYFPMMWFDQHDKDVNKVICSKHRYLFSLLGRKAGIDDEMAQKLVFVTEDLRSYIKAAAFSMIGIGLFLLALAVAIIVHRMVQKEKLTEQKKSEGKNYELANTKDPAPKEKEYEEAKDAKKNLKKKNKLINKTRKVLS